MRVVVIGGTDFLGPPMVRRLVALGHEVAVFHRGRTRAELPPAVGRIVGDRHQLAGHVSELRRFRPDVVVDMIAYTEADAAGLVEAFRGLARRLVVISSADVYRAYGRFAGIETGPPEPSPIAEDAPLRTVLFPYRRPGQSPDEFFFTYDKIPVERLVLACPELPGTVLRLPMVYGPGDPYRRLAPYLKRMDDGRPAIVLDEGLAGWKCPRGYVDDVAAAIALAVVDDRASGRVYNVGEPHGFTEAEWIRRVGERAGWRGRVLSVPRGRVPIPFDVDQSIDTDTTRIRRDLGFREEVAPGEALGRTIPWERENPAGQVPGIGLLEYDAEDALLTEPGVPEG